MASAAVVAMAVTVTAIVVVTRLYGRSGFDVTASVGPAASTVTFDGGWVDVPAGAFDQTVAMRVRSATTVRSAAMDSASRPLGGAISIELPSGRQPARPLRVAVQATMPPAASSELLFMATAPVSGGAPQLLAAVYEPSRHAVMAEVAHLSLFWPVLLDAKGTIDLLITTIAQVLEVRTPRPAACADDAPLADGGRVAFVDASWRTGTDPRLWGCLARPDDSHITVALSNNRPMAYSVQVPKGAVIHQEPPSLDSSTMQLLFAAATHGRTDGQILFTGGSTLRISVPVSGRLFTGASVIVAAIHSQQAVVAASAAQTGFLIMADLLAPSSRVLTGALAAADNLDCIVAALTAQPDPPNLDQILNGVRVGLRCLGPVLGSAGRVVSALLTVVTSFLRTMTSAWDLVARQLGGAVSDVVSLQRAGGPAPTSTPTKPLATQPPGTAPAASGPPAVRLLETIQEGECLYTVKFLLTNFKPGSEVYVSDTHSYTWCDTGAKGTQEWTVRASGLVQPNGSLVWGYKQTVPMHSTHRLHFEDNAGNAANITVTCSKSNVVCAVS